MLKKHQAETKLAPQQVGGLLLCVCVFVTYLLVCVVAVVVIVLDDGRMVKDNKNN